MGHPAADGQLVLVRTCLAHQKTLAVDNLVLNHVVLVDERSQPSSETVGLGLNPEI